MLTTGLIYFFLSYNYIFQCRIYMDESVGGGRRTGRCGERSAGPGAARH